MNPLSLITKGILGVVESVINRYYELPIQVDIDYGDIKVENLIEQEINLIVEVE